MYVKEHYSVCVCVCVCERERERERGFKCFMTGSYGGFL